MLRGFQETSNASKPNKTKNFPFGKSGHLCPSLFLPTRKLSRGLGDSLETTHPMGEPTLSGTTSEMTSHTDHTPKLTIIILPLSKVKAASPLLRE